MFNFIQGPLKLIYPTDWLPTKDSEQMAMIDEFVDIVEKSLGVTRTEISLSKEWALTAPRGSASHTNRGLFENGKLKPQSIADFALTNSKTGLWVNMYPGYQNFESFRDRFKVSSE